MGCVCGSPKAPPNGEVEERNDAIIDTPLHSSTDSDGAVIDCGDGVEKKKDHNPDESVDSTAIESKEAVAEQEHCHSSLHHDTNPTRPSLSYSSVSLEVEVPEKKRPQVARVSSIAERLKQYNSSLEEDANSKHPKQSSPRQDYGGGKTSRNRTSLLSDSIGGRIESSLVRIICRAATNVLKCHVAYIHVSAHSKLVYAT
jgi:hypothetical protein